MVALRIELGGIEPGGGGVVVSNVGRSAPSRSFFNEVIIVCYS